jgi:hypothetical protein
MADETKGNGAGDSSSEKKPDSTGGSGPTGAKRQTARIDLAEARSSADKESTDHIRMPGGAATDDKESTDRIRMPAGAATDDKDITEHIRMPGGAATDDKESTDRIRMTAADGGGKKPTARIDVSEATTAGIPPTPSRAAKSQTARIDISEVAPPKGGEAPPGAGAVPDAALNQTLRVEVDEEAKARRQTTRVPASESPGEGTARIELQKDPEAEDVFKRHVGEQAAGVSQRAARPRTVRIKRSAVPPAEAPEAETEASTVDASAGKRQTARVDLPTEATAATAGRPKTIKIKRAEMPPPEEEAASPTAQAAAPSPRLRRPQVLAREEPVGALFSFAALITVLATGALLYLLLAQTFLPTLPIPGILGP